jgi:uncharacterized protein
MQFNVAQLLKEPTGSIRRYELVEDITELDPELVVMGPLVGDVQLLRINSGVLVEAGLSTAVRLTCNRCLAPIATPVRFTLEESFRPLTEVATGRYLPPDEFEGAEEDLEDEALIIDEHHILDISEVVRQNIWLALPMYPSCIWSGPGECPNLVAYRQEIEATRANGAGEAPEGEEAIDPRWSALLALRKRLDTEE